jgi:hypothetical protein
MPETDKVKPVKHRRPTPAVSTALLSRQHPQVTCGLGHGYLIPQQVSLRTVLRWRCTRGSETSHAGCSVGHSAQSPAVLANGSYSCPIPSAACAAHSQPASSAAMVCSDQAVWPLCASDISSFTAAGTTKAASSKIAPQRRNCTQLDRVTGTCCSNRSGFRARGSVILRDFNRWWQGLATTSHHARQATALLKKRFALRAAGSLLGRSTAWLC